MSERTQNFIKTRVKCCGCRGSLNDSEQINLVCLMKQAKWENPCWGNVLLKVYGFASAVLCDKCIKDGKQPQFAVEWNKDFSVVKYHRVEDLIDVPQEIFEPLDDLEPGRHGIAG